MKIVYLKDILDRLIEAVRRNAMARALAHSLSIAASAEQEDPDEYVEVYENDFEGFVHDYTQEEKADDAARLFGEGILDEVTASGTPAPSKLTGDLAQTSISSTLAVTGTTTSGSAAVTGVTPTTSLAQGQAISGAGIPANTTISNISGSTVTLSNPATTTASGVSLSVLYEEQIIGLGEWTLDWKRKTADSTTTDDADYESALPSTKSWTAKAKYMFVDGDQSQVDAVLSTIDGSGGGAPLWNFFPTVASGRAAFQGNAIVDGITISSGVGKIVGLDVSLKGTGPLRRLVQVTPTTNPNTTTGLEAEV